MDEVMEAGTDEAAARWFARVRAGDMTTRETVALTTWLEERPEHRVAYDEMQAAWELSRAAASHEAMRAMRAAALAARPTREASTWRARPWAIAAAGAGLAVLVAFVALNSDFRSTIAKVAGVTATPARSYSTAVGERSTIALEDGSTVVLNTGSRMKVAFTAGERSITLSQGQALFEVAKDHRRPFVVHAADRRIVAVGTAFDVRLDAQSVQVTLIEGRVNVEELAGKDSQRVLRRAHMEAGQQLVAQTGSAPSGKPDLIRAADGALATSWRDGRVTFENESLDAVIAELNRYSDRKLRLGDASLSELRLSGTFHTGNPASFALALGEYFPVQVSDRPDQDLEVRWREKK